MICELGTDLASSSGFGSEDLGLGFYGFGTGSELVMGVFRRTCL